MDSDDSQLMQQVRNGEFTQLGRLFERYYPQLTQYFYHQCGCRGTAEDLAQDTFWRILRYRDSFRPSHSFRGWMFQIARRRLYDHFRVQSRSAESTRRISESPAETGDNHPQLDVESNEQRKLLKMALDRLPDEKREILILARFQQLSYHEISETLGCRVGTVKARISRAMALLREYYQQMEKETLV